MPQLDSPEKELRFTRSQQSIVFWILGALLFTVGVTLTLLVTSAYREVNPDLPHPAWALLPWVMAVAAFRWAIRLTRHAYLILTPLGLEIFPLWKPEDHMRVVFWHEVAEVEFDDALTLMTLHHDKDHSSGIHLSLRPIPKPQRLMLEKAMRARVKSNESAS